MMRERAPVRLTAAVGSLSYWRGLWPWHLSAQGPGSCMHPSDMSTVTMDFRKHCGDLVMGRVTESARNR